MSEWLIPGVQEELRAEFRNKAGALADATVSLTVMGPDKVAEDVTPVHDSTGIYHYDLTVDQPGRWIYRWEATGALVGAEEGQLFVRRSRVA